MGPIGKPRPPEPTWTKKYFIINGPDLPKKAQKAIVLHVFGVHAGSFQEISRPFASHLAALPVPRSLPVRGLQTKLQTWRIQP